MPSTGFKWRVLINKWRDLSYRRGSWIYRLPDGLRNHERQVKFGVPTVRSKVLGIQFTHIHTCKYCDTISTVRSRNVVSRYLYEKKIYLIRKRKKSKLEIGTRTATLHKQTH